VGVASAYAARIARRAAEYGVVIGGDIGIDMPRPLQPCPAPSRGRSSLNRTLMFHKTAAFS
jgi:hypothetical protein